LIQVSLGALRSYPRKPVGTSIYVTGSLFADFTFVKQNWGQAITDQLFRSILIAEVPEASVALPELTPPITNFMLDNEAKSPLELALLTNRLLENHSGQAFFSYYNFMLLRWA